MTARARGLRPAHDAAHPTLRIHGPPPTLLSLEPAALYPRFLHVGKAGPARLRAVLAAQTPALGPRKPAQRSAHERQCHNQPQAFVHANARTHATTRKHAPRRPRRLACTHCDAHTLGPSKTTTQHRTHCCTHIHLEPWYSDPLISYHSMISVDG